MFGNEAWGNQRYRDRERVCLSVCLSGEAFPLNQWNAVPYLILRVLPSWILKSCACVAVSGCCCLLGSTANCVVQSPTPLHPLTSLAAGTSTHETAKWPLATTGSDRERPLFPLSPNEARRLECLSTRLSMKWSIWLSTNVHGRGRLARRWWQYLNK